MSKNQARCVHVANALVGITGVAYAWFLYGMDPLEEFAIVNHPWQPHSQHLHILFAPLLVFAIGLIWPNHVWQRFRSGFRRHRRTGVILMVLFAPMVASGYGLQVSESETMRMACKVLHLTTSIVWLVLAMIHPLLGRKGLLSSSQSR